MNPIDEKGHFEITYIFSSSTKADFQSDAYQMVLSANQITTKKESANHRGTSKYHCEIPSKETLVSDFREKLFDHVTKTPSQAQNYSTP